MMNLAEYRNRNARLADFCEQDRGVLPGQRKDFAERVTLRLPRLTHDCPSSGFLGQQAA
jgi:hypothetical protein